MGGQPGGLSYSLILTLKQSARFRRTHHLNDEEVALEITGGD